MEAKLDDQRENKKQEGKCPIRQEKQKPEEGQCSARQRQNKEEKDWKWEDKEKCMSKKECTLEREVLVNLDQDSVPFEIFQTVTGMNELLEIIAVETNRYATQKRSQL